MWMLTGISRLSATIILLVDSKIWELLFAMSFISICRDFDYRREARRFALPLLSTIAKRGLTSALHRTPLSPVVAG